MRLSQCKSSPMMPRNPGIYGFPLFSPFHIIFTALCRAWDRWGTADPFPVDAPKILTLKAISLRRWWINGQCPGCQSISNRQTGTRVHLFIYLFWNMVQQEEGRGHMLSCRWPCLTAPRPPSMHRPCRKEIGQARGEIEQLLEGPPAVTGLQTSPALRKQNQNRPQAQNVAPSTLSPAEECQASSGTRPPPQPPRSNMQSWGPH